MRRKVLVIGGGGVFGCIPALFMSTPSAANVYNDVDCFAGTSIGSVLASCYADGVPPGVLLDFFIHRASKVFAPRPWWKGPKVFGAKHDDKELNAALKELLPLEFGLIDRPVFIPSYNMLARRLKVFDNITGDPDARLEAWIPARCSVAAPTFLPVYEWFVDGGIVENIPVMTVLVGVARKLGWNWGDIDVLSLGTGHRVGKVDYKLSNINNWWTPACWLNHIKDWLTQCNEQASVQWATTLADAGVLGSYTHYDPVKLDNNWDMDDASKVEEAIRRASVYQADFERMYKTWLER